jgi:acyl-CoA thioester hydrolase
MGHLNVAYYVQKFDQATWNFFADVGLTLDYIRDNKIVMAAVEQVITYKRELLPGDVLIVRTQLLELAGKKIRFRHVMTHGVTGEEAAITDQLALCVDAEARKSRPFPGEIIANGVAILAGQTG